MSSEEEEEAAPPPPPVVVAAGAAAAWTPPVCFVCDGLNRLNKYLKKVGKPYVDDITRETMVRRGQGRCKWHLIQRLVDQAKCRVCKKSVGQCYEGDLHEGGSDSDGETLLRVWCYHNETCLEEYTEDFRKHLVALNCGPCSEPLAWYSQFEFSEDDARCLIYCDACVAKLKENLLLFEGYSA